MRRNMIVSDVVEAVIGLGPNLFYNSSMVSCLLVTNNNKPKERKDKILFIDAIKEVRQEKTMSYLDPEHIDKIYQTFKGYAEENGFSKIIDKSVVLDEPNARLSVQLYVDQIHLQDSTEEFGTLYQNWTSASDELKQSMDKLLG